ncbi:sugar kinase [Flavimaricola marinus]|uniref:2-dehydro-3-deoxygluconokinase n=1 Tax=Flavimaricola marinus TaxID=1819565 RepID=A0A238LDG4_9RHOB|nr:sugar kinase [Flavimaricola marinus]SMY07668.1 2-dehydro-3-deoxygluconokinase [Flavimaricola marinus]
MHSKPLLSGPVSKAMCFATIGECMVEMAPSAAPGQFTRSFAGDTFNTLWYVRQLQPDWQARYVSRVGQDQISDEMVQMMSGIGIDTSHIQRSADRTVGLYLISLDAGERSFSYWRSQSAARQLADDPNLLNAAFSDADVLFLSGITLAILSGQARSHLFGALASAREAGKTIVFDPNLRPKLWSDRDQMRQTIMQGAAASDIVLPSFEEEAEHFGDASPEGTITRYRAAGCRSIVVKDGGAAVSYWHEAQTGQVVPEPVSVVVDTTSAGDSFNAGFLAGLAQTASVEDAIDRACRVARQVIAQRGALVTLDMSLLGTP